MNEKCKNEYCMACNKETDVPVNLHIDFRNYYVEGAGQLCKECFERIYGKNNFNNS